MLTVYVYYRPDHRWGFARKITRDSTSPHDGIHVREESDRTLTPSRWEAGHHYWYGEGLGVGVGKGPESYPVKSTVGLVITGLRVQIYSNGRRNVGVAF